LGTLLRYLREIDIFRAPISAVSAGAQPSSLGYNQTFLMGTISPDYFRSHSGASLRLRRDSRKLGGFVLAALLAGILFAPRPMASDQLRTQSLEVREEETDFDAAATLAQKRELDALLRTMRAAADANVKSALAKVKSVNLQALGQALQAGLVEANSETSVTSASSLERLGDLDGDGTPELLFKWSRAERFPLHNSDIEGLLPAWSLFLLSWDGAAWRASRMMDGNGLYDAEILPRLGAAPALAVIEGITLSPYPVVFRLENHAAVLSWDSRAEESLFQSFAGGDVAFRDVEGVKDPVLVVSGRADPGFLIFPRGGRRGFLAMSVYTWDGKSYVPRRTEYSENEDYVLYRFISALHLHDFRGAYSLVDPSKFLKNSEPRLELFRKYVEDNWPEFLENNIFEARDAAPDSPDDLSFELKRDGTTYVYHPTFSSGSKYLLTSLRRGGD